MNEKHSKIVLVIYAALAVCALLVLVRCWRLTKRLDAMITTMPTPTPIPAPRPMPPETSGGATLTIGP